MLSSRGWVLLVDEILQPVYSLNQYIVVIVVGSPPYITHRPLQTHPFISARIFSSLTAPSHIQRLYESLQCSDVMIANIIIKWASLPLAVLVSQGRCPRTSISMIVGHDLLLEMSGWL